MKIVRFRLSGRFGHFLKAEANASAPSYPVPPRTALLGLLGAVLGLEKDEPQVLLGNAKIAVSGPLTQTHWHTAKLRKDPPTALSRAIKRGQGEAKTTKPEKATLIAQEWLFNPNFLVWANLQNSHHETLVERLQRRLWYFQPCLGISEHLAELSFEDSIEVTSLPLGSHDVVSVFPQSAGELNTDEIFKRSLAIHFLRMPREVSKDRVFSHENYYMERNATPVPVNTDQAYQVGDKNIIFL